MKKLLMLLICLSAVADTIKLEWDASPDATGYSLYESLGTQPFFMREKTPNTFLFWNVVEPARFYVTAYNATTGLESLPSNTISYTPSMISTLAFEAESGGIVSPFYINNGSVIQQDIQTGLSDGGTASYTFSVATSGEYYLFMTLNAPGSSSDSVFVNVDAQPVDPGNIWDIAPATTGLQERQLIFRGATTPKAFSLSSGNHTLIIRGREAGVQIDKIEFKPTTTQPPPPPPPALPATPTNLRATTITDTRIDIRWDPITDGSTVLVERGLSSTSLSQVGTVAPTQTFYISDGLRKNRTYYFRVRARNAAGALSAYSNLAATTTSRR